MIRVEYAIETGVSAPVELFAVLGIIFVLGLIVMGVSRFIVKSQAGFSVGLIMSIVGLVLFYASAVGSSYSKFPDEEISRVAAVLTEKTCVEVTETDVLIMEKGMDGGQLSFEYDKLRHDGKTYFTMEGKC